MDNVLEIRKPIHEVRAVRYDSDCQEALTSHLDNLIDQAVAQGWDRTRVASALMYLAAKRLNTAPS